ncbi:argininosuccinate lyase [Bacillus sp. MB2021]|uniref:argininosuccinate lyase n=1 Tax=Bacillus sp. MB2021 TaxID=1408303 RepID=UPI000689EEC4|nr:argininosuccinate lyase [Bacillus sp. MB2021]
MPDSRSHIYVNHILEPTYDFTKQHFLPYLLEINIAHATMLARQKILKIADTEKIIKANQGILAKGYGKNYDPIFEDLFFMIEEDLKQEIGEELVGNMHIAFSRNDMDATMYRMLAREKLLHFLTVLIELKKVLLGLAKEHERTIMPAYTHNQQAQPTTLAHYLLAIDSSLERDLERGFSLLKRINQSPMGAAALGTSGFPIDRAFMATQLAFDKAMENSYDSISAADYMLEIASVIKIALSTLSRFTHDLMFFTTNEVDAIRLDESLVQTSSIMPQKRNPSSLEHTKSLISRTIGEINAVFMMPHNAPFGDIVDIGDDIQPILINGFSHSYQIIELLTEILKSMEVNVDKLFTRCCEGFSTVTELADVLVRECHLSFRDSHQIASVLVQQLSSSGKKINDGSAELVKQIAKEILGTPLVFTEAHYKNAIDPYQFVLVRSVLGGPNPKESERQRICSTQHVEAFSKEVETYRQKFTSYKQLLHHNSYNVLSNNK